MNSSLTKLPNMGIIRKSAIAAGLSAAGRGRNIVEAAQGMDARRYLSVQEFKQLSGLSLATIHRYLKSGKLPFRQPAGPRSRVLIPTDALDILCRSTQPPITPPLATDADLTPDRDATNDPPLSGPRPKWQRRLAALSTK